MITMYKVPMLNDYPPFRGNFIYSTMSSDLAYLDAKGKIILLKSEVQGAIMALFREIEKRMPDLAGKVSLTVTPSIPRPLISIEAYVTSVERLVKAIR